MSLTEILYKLIIGPLELFFEVVFSISLRVVHNPALAIIMLSLAMNILVLPLYRRADAMQAEERDMENKLKPWIDHIKKTFKGDERFMMLQAYYRQNNYKPTYALKGSLSLLLEIPFFIAAYRFLSGLQLLKGVPFGPIKDLGVADGLINIGGTSINLLPILMTLINVISAAIYMKGFPLKSKVQMYGVAGVFLVFLYNSPAGLVFYWTLNNIFSLVKNIFYKIKNPVKVLRIGLSIVGIALLGFILFIHPMRSTRIQVIVVLGILMLQLPLILNYLKTKGIHIGKGIETDTPLSNKAFYISTGFLTILTGLLIPSQFIRGSAEEFLNLSNYLSPFWYIVSAFLLALGTFMLWFNIFYRLSGNTGKRVLSFITLSLSLMFTVNYMFFGKNYGNISPSLFFDEDPKIPGMDMLLNLALMGVIALITFILWKKKERLLQTVVLAGCLAIFIMSSINLLGINGELKKAQTTINTAKESAGLNITLSATGRNVVVIMLDRACGFFVPYLLEEKPELKEIYSGFTFYPNTVSFGQITNVGSPGLYGGYEYIPEALNARPDEPLEIKQNEALKLMPVMFDREGYNVSICDPTYAGYSWIPDLSIFNDYPNIETSLGMGKFDAEKYGYLNSGGVINELRKRNFFCYSIFKCAPLFIQPTLYDFGRYNKADVISDQQVTEGFSVSKGLYDTFMESYAELHNLKNVTEISTSSTGGFFMMSNDTTHEPCILKLPEYEPSKDIDNRGIDGEKPTRSYAGGETITFKDPEDYMHYQVNMAALLKLGDWLNYLKENNVYDNTRIIIVSDHARAGLIDGTTYLDAPGGGLGEDRKLDVRAFNSLLLFKDFNAKEFKVDESFMTNADTPTLAVTNLLTSTTNPFTGKEINSKYKDENKEIRPIYTYNYRISEHHGNTFDPGYWFSVHDDVRDMSNWKYIEYK